MTSEPVPTHQRPPNVVESRLSDSSRSCPECVLSTFGLLRGQHGEQPGSRGPASAQVVRGMWREDFRALPAVFHGALLAHALPEVLVLPGPAGGHRPQLLQ